MKLYIVTANLDRGTVRAYQGTFKNIKSARDYVNTKFKQKLDKWDGDTLDCHDKGNDWDNHASYVGYIEITTVNIN